MKAVKRITSLNFIADILADWYGRTQELVYKYMYYHIIWKNINVKDMHVDIDIDGGSEHERYFTGAV